MNPLTKREVFFGFSMRYGVSARGHDGHSHFMPLLYKSLNGCSGALARVLWFGGEKKNFFEEGQGSFVSGVVTCVGFAAGPNAHGVLYEIEPNDVNLVSRSVGCEQS